MDGAVEEEEGVVLSRTFTPHKPGTALPKLAPLKPIQTPQVHISAWARRKFRQPVKKSAPQRELRHNHTFPAPKRLRRITEEDRRGNFDQRDAWNDLTLSDHAKMRRRHQFRPSCGLLQVSVLPTCTSPCKAASPPYGHKAQPSPMKPVQIGSPVASRRDGNAGTPSLPDSASPAREDSGGSTDHPIHGGLNPVHVAVQFSTDVPDEMATPSHARQARGAPRSKKRVASSPGGLTNAAHPDVVHLRSTLLDIADSAMGHAALIEQRARKCSSKGPSCPGSSGVAGDSANGDGSSHLIPSFAGEAPAAAPAAAAPPRAPTAAVPVPVPPTRRPAWASRQRPAPPSECCGGLLARLRTALCLGAPAAGAGSGSGERAPETGDRGS